LKISRFTTLQTNPSRPHPTLGMAHESHWNLQKQGEVRLELRFVAALPTAVNGIVYSEFNNLIKIDKNRSVIVDYSV